MAIDYHRNGNAANFADDATTVRKPDYKELGVSGTRLFAGVLSEETVPQLQGQNAYKTFNGMRFDATGASLLRAITLPIRSARWFVDPASEDPKDVQIADFVHSVLFDFGSQSFDDVCRLATEGALAFGFNICELIWAPIDFGEFQGKVGWDSLAWRSQNSKWRWNMDVVNGRRQLVSFTQLAPPWYQQTEIPRNKFLLWVNALEGDRYDGISIFRPAWKDYFIRDRLYRVRSIGLERAYMSIPVASLPEGYSSELKDLAKQIVETVRTDEQAGVIKPQELELALENWQLNGPVMDNAINYHNRQMLMSALAQFLDLGSGGGGATGSYALSSDQSELFLQSVLAHANYFGEVMNLEPGIPSLVDMNYPNMDRAKMPRLDHGDIGQRSLDTLGRTLMALAQFGFLTPDDVTEDRLRQMLDLPEREANISADALSDLSQELFPIQPEYGRTGHGQRLQSPLATAAAAKAGPPAAGAPGASSIPQNDGSPDAAGGNAGAGQVPNVGDGGPAGSYAEAQQRFSEMLVRRQWDRPKGRPTPDQRQAMRATEVFTEKLEDVYQDMQHQRKHKPLKPSERIARNRKPYVVQGADPKPRTQPAHVQAVQSRQQALAKRYRTELVEALRPKVDIGPKP